MASRILSDSILTTRNQRTVPARTAVSRVAARRAMGLCLAIAMLLFVYVAEVSQGTTTAFDIEQMTMEHRQWQESNQELERAIAELESPSHVLRYAEAHGMAPRTDMTYLTIPSATDPR